MEEKNKVIVIEYMIKNDSFGICRVEKWNGQEKIDLVPLETDFTLGGAEKKLKEILEKDVNDTFVIVKYYKKGYQKEIIKNQPKLPKKQFAVFTKPFDNKSKVYYWGVIEAHDRISASHAIEIIGWYLRNSEMYLYQLENGRLKKNYFPSIPILTPYDENYEGLKTKIKGVKITPLEDILPKNENKNEKNN